MRDQLVVVPIPNAEQVLVAEVLLKRTKNELACRPSVSVTAYGAYRPQQCGQDEQLALVEHGPPMGEAMIRYAPIVHRSHEAERNFTPRPVRSQILVLAFGPFTRGRIEVG